MHRLVAAYLDYKAPPSSSTDDGGDDEGGAGPATWMGGMGSLPASPDLAAATTVAEGLAAAERMFFGEVKNVQQL